MCLHSSAGLGMTSENGSTFPLRARKYRRTISDFMRISLQHTSLKACSFPDVTGRRWKRGWWPRPESNQRHADFQSAALPTELLGHFGCVGLKVQTERQRGRVLNRRHRGESTQKDEIEGPNRRRCGDWLPTNTRSSAPHSEPRTRAARRFHGRSGRGRGGRGCPDTGRWSAVCRGQPAPRRR